MSTTRGSLIVHQRSARSPNFHAMYAASLVNSSTIAGSSQPERVRPAGTAPLNGSTPTNASRIAIGSWIHSGSAK
jgi:hypothetical protein